MQVLFIGANPRTAEIATLSVRLRWPEVTPLLAATATDGLRLAGQASPDLVLLHPDFRDMSLPEALTQLRGVSNAPLLILGHEGDEIEVVTALQLGADDYIRLPCNLTEIVARIWAMLRRSGNGVDRGDSERLILSGRLQINPATYEVFLSGRRVQLTSTEFRLLYLLIKNHSAVVSHQALEDGLWGDQTDSFGLVKKYIQRLRRKLEDDAREPRWIASVHGVGYRFIGPSPSSREFSESTPSSNR
jgi:DNA-binding response OmpR family regulator